MMEAASPSETSVKFYQTTRRNNPEDSHLQTKPISKKYGVSIVPSFVEISQVVRVLLPADRRKNSHDERNVWYSKFCCSPGAGLHCPRPAQDRIALQLLELATQS
jgi:hypothetical protein